MLPTSVLHSTGCLFTVLLSSLMEEVTVSDHPEYQAAIDAIDSVVGSLRGEIAGIERQIEALQADRARLSKLSGRPPAKTGRNPQDAQPQRRLDFRDKVARLESYIEHNSETGQVSHLRSAEMVADVVASLRCPVTRKQIIAAFFDRFPRRDLEQVWHGDVDNAVAIAIRRAAQRGLIEKVERNLYRSPQEGGSMT